MPTAPRSVNAVNSDTNKVTVSWDAPTSDGGQSVDDYIVAVEDGGDYSYAYAAGTDRSVTILSDIKPGTWPVRV